MTIDNYMTINDLHGLSTVFVMLAFIGVCWWAFSPRRKQRFNDAANLPFADENKHVVSQSRQALASSDIGELFSTEQYSKEQCSEKKCSEKKCSEKKRSEERHSDARQG